MDERKAPDLRPSILHTSSRFLYDEWLRLSQQLENEELTKEQKAEIEDKRLKLFKEYEAASEREKAEPQAIGRECLENLKYAIKQKDKNLLRKAIITIQEFVNCPNFNKDLKSLRFTDEELNEILNNRSGTIIVGSGTYGQRIFVSSKQLLMNGDKHGQQYRERFAKLFGIQFVSDKDLSVKY